MEHFNLDRDFSEVLRRGETDPETLKYVRKEFEKHGAFFPDDACLSIQQTSDGWKICDQIVNVRRVLYFIKKRKELLEVHKPASFSGFSKQLWDYSVFKIWLPIQESPNDEIDTKQLLRTGKERPNLLNEKQRKKWDYFFRPSLPHVGLEQKKNIRELKKIADSNGRKANEQRILGIVLSMLGLLAAIGTAKISGGGLVPLISILAFGCGVFIKSFIPYKKLMEENEKINLWIERLQKEIEHLYSQIPADLPTDAQISKWLDEEIRELEKEAIVRLDLDLKNMLRLDEELNPRDFQGILIDDWAAIQPSSSVGKSSINTLHLWGMRVGKDLKPRFSAYYIQFVFPMVDQIAVYGCFYDFILQERKGIMNRELLYRNVVSVDSLTLEERFPLNPNKQIETTIFRLTVANGDAIQVALTDKAIIFDMNERIKAKNESMQENYQKMREDFSDDSFENISEDEYEREIKIVENEIQATRGWRAIEFIRREHRNRSALQRNG